MSDKLARTVAVTSEFVDGEQPVAAKLSLVGNQLKAATETIEKVVGDVHDQNWPYHTSYTGRLNSDWGRDRTTGAALSTEARFLGIANLARLIGSAANLNPRGLGTKNVTETVPSGVREFALTYPPDDHTAVVFTDTALATRVASVSALDAAGEYYIDETGHVWCITATTAGESASYDVTPLKFGGGQSYTGATFNVIPDPSQSQVGAYELTVTGPDVNGRYLVSLPIVSAQQSNLDGTSETLTDIDLTYNQQLTLPEELSGITGEIPQGFVILRDDTLNEVYVSATYEYINQTSFYVSGVTLATANKFTVLTVGTSITTAIDDLRVKQRHSHDRTFGEPPVHIDDIVGMTEDVAFVKSQIPGNFAPQYLMRTGAIADGYNDDNVMIQHLVIGSQDQSRGSKKSQTGNSYSLLFGSDAPALGVSLTGLKKTSDHDLEIFAHQYIRNKDPILAENGIGSYANGDGLMVATVINGSSSVPLETPLIAPYTLRFSVPLNSTGPVDAIIIPQHLPLDTYRIVSISGMVEIAVTFPSTLVTHFPIPSNDALGGTRIVVDTTAGLFPEIYVIPTGTGFVGDTYTVTLVLWVERYA